MDLIRSISAISVLVGDDTSVDTTLTVLIVCVACLDLEICRLGRLDMQHQATGRASLVSLRRTGRSLLLTIPREGRHPARLAWLGPPEAHPSTPRIP